MHSDFAVLQKIIKANLMISPTENATTLSETEGEEPYEINITNIVAESLIIKIENILGGSSKFFNSQKQLGLRKNADYFILIHKNNVKYLLVIELKESLNPQSDQTNIKLQLKGAACLFKYCQEIGRQFFSNEAFLSDYEIIFIALYKMASVSQLDTTETTADSPSKAGTTTDFPKILIGESFELEQLLN